MPAPTQAKLLRVLEDRKVRRLGSKSETPVDVRVLAATNKDPDQAVGSGHLRQDLYFRLNVVRIDIPPPVGPTGPRGKQREGFDP